MTILASGIAAAATSAQHLILLPTTNQRAHVDIPHFRRQWLAIILCSEILSLLTDAAEVIMTATANHRVLQLPFLANNDWSNPISIK